MDPATETALVRRAQKGDRAAFDDLVRATARLVWAHVYGLARDPAWVEDLVQETFARAWESIRGLQDPGAFRSWLLTTARRLAWRHAEVSGRMSLVGEVPERADEPDEGPLDPDEARERVQAALAALPERYRLPVTLHFLNGMDYESISRTLGLANGSLRGLLARGTAKLRASLAPWWRTQS